MPLPRIPKCSIIRPMAKPRYSYTLTLDDEDAKAIEEIAYDAHLTPTAAVKKAFLDRLTLERAGWNVGDDQVEIALRAIAGLKGKELESAIEFIEKL